MGVILELDIGKIMSKRYAVWGSDKTYGSKLSASLAAGVMAAKDRLKQGAVGNQNAAKDRRKSSQVVFRCFEEDRETWEARAKADGLSLGAWICRELNRPPDMCCK